ncbi:phage tail length tape measure family protein [Bradyrhizobium sp. PRIMUS42]|uniref:phage tail length tape measure family protein n=1 Tax=Bradyrhizobium sp. PRIMUS42 TaxID=2908926 RepID=UPI001FF231DC|nr:phage tail length tape measure family protein [Bradyrhizobium sp. PRIMUS42]MCJ9731294.1 phage tail length tape measure family protein [Bradyrhizobium sp. PRIMUS42]
MSTDIATLGLKIDSSQVTTADAALNKFQASANAAAAGADKLQAATKTTGANVAAVGKAAETADKAMQNIAKSTGLTRSEMINLSRQLQDVGVSLVSGQSPFMVLAQQGAQIADIFGSSKTGTVGGALRQIGSGIASVLTPMRLLGGGAALLATGFAVAANSIIKSELALDDFARSTDLSLTKIHALQQSASFKGIGNEDFQKGITGFADGVYQAQRNFGSLNSLMIANGKSAKDLSGYLGNVADLVARATSDVEKQKILREAGLPSDAAWVRYMEQGSKGIQTAADGTIKFNESAELNLIRKAREFDDAWNTASTKMGQYLKSGILEGINALDTLQSKVRDFGNASFWTKFTETTGKLGLNSDPKKMGIEFGVPFADRFGSFDKPLNSNGLQRGLNQRAGVAEPKTSAELMVANQQAQQRIALLGNLATVEDQVKAKELELAAAALQGVGVSKQQAEAIKNVVRAQAEMSRVSEQASIGVFSFRDASKAAADTLQSWVDRGIVNPKDLEAFAAASNYAAKSVEALSDQAKVAGSLLPQFQAAINEVGNARKQLDSVMVDAMSTNRSFFVSFGQQIRSGASAWNAFKSSGLDALGKISDRLMQMAADSLFASAFGGSSSGGLLGLLGIGSGSVPVMSSGLGAGTGGLSFPMFANGGTLAGGWGVVGERGPELINVHKGGATIIPNHVSRAMLPGFADGGTLSPSGAVSRLAAGTAPGNVSAPVSIAIDARGADKDGLARVEGQLRQLKAELPGRVVSAVTDAKKKRML